MNVRERMEQEEYEFLSPQAQKAAETKGRPEPEDDNDVRTIWPSSVSGIKSPVWPRMPMRTS